VGLENLGRKIQEFEDDVETEMLVVDQHGVERVSSLDVELDER
jgi:hypothetical protein